MGLRVSREHEKGVNPLVSRIYMSWKPYPNYRMFREHIWKDLRSFCYLDIRYTIQREAEPANLNLLIQILDKAFLHTMDRDYGKYA